MVSRLENGMIRLLLVATVALLGVGGWYASAHYSLEVHRTAEGAFQYVRIVPRAAKSEKTVETPSDQPPAAPLKPTIRIATFNLDGLDDSRLANPKVSEGLVRMLSRFDVVALQNISTANGGVLMRLKDLVNATGRSYDFAVLPARDEVKGPAAHAIDNAFLFDAATVEVDHSSLYSVEAPPGTFHMPPLVAEFRVRAPPLKEAFTFTLVSVLSDSPGGSYEMSLLADVFHAVVKNSHGEDDIIMLGDFEADPEHFDRLGNVPGITAAITDAPTTLRGTRLTDNILFDRRATVEYTGRSGVLDMVRELDLTPQEALEISSHLPVWAEFSAYENGQASHVN
jgi:hypothetical protein